MDNSELNTSDTPSVGPPESTPVPSASTPTVGGRKSRRRSKKQRKTRRGKKNKRSRRR